MKAFLDFSDDQRSWRSLECEVEDGQEVSRITVPNNWQEKAKARYYRIRLAPPPENRTYIVVGGPFGTLDAPPSPDK